MNSFNNFLLFISLVIGGVLLEIAISQLHYYATNKHIRMYHFSLARYGFLLLIPLLATIFMVIRVGSSILTTFLIFAVLGTFLEWLVGFAYHMIVGQKLWTYKRYNISTYTSVLSIPIWGLAGIAFWLLAQAL